MRELFEIVFYSGDQPLPAYYVIDQFACENMEEELKNKISYLMETVRNAFNIGKDISDHKISEALYILQEDGLIPIHDID
jgi:hypothetical protein